ncbi:MAG: Type I Iterative PKS [Sclerophora amabilis]|nr:MAG: Type I Iterative PKS [Sclerophora amabilis]
MAPGLVYPDFKSFSDASSSSGHDAHHESISDFQDDTPEQDKLEPIAVVGFSLKFPQEATSPESFWGMLTEKRCTMTEWPKERINLDAFYHPDANRNDGLPARGAHFLTEELGAFDAPFFSITSAEAMAMDPQHRGLLETAYRALENAGIPLDKVFGSKTSVYTGCFTDDYKMMVFKDTETLPKYAATGLAVTMLANRLSWFFNLTGPSVNLDSACSSSMMALDLACQGLRNRDSTMALVAGSNLVYEPAFMLALTNMNFLSPDSRCFSFDDRANGYARGEGFGVVVIKLLSDALRDGDTIRAVIRSTGSNQDGRTPGITQPSGDAQESLIRETYDKAGLDMETTRFFEAHGTGTPIGDPIEASAIGGAFRKHRDSDEPLYIGALKSNIGHLEGASGIAGLIKTVMVLEKGVIPPNTNFESLNPKIDAEFLKLKFPRFSIPWPSRGLRRASVNSFGYGGSNSHTVLDDAFNYLRLRKLVGNHSTVREPPSFEELYHSLPPSSSTAMAHSTTPETPATRDDDSRPKLLVWSAADEGGLKRLAVAYSRHFSESRPASDDDAAYLENLAYTLAVRRSSLSWKSFVVARSVSEIADLTARLSKPLRSILNPKIGYIFTGQGAQFPGMGRELLAYPVFKNTLRKVEMYFRDLGCQWSLFDELLRDKETSSINNPSYSQPLCTALQLALVDLLRTFAILPSAVVGHSSGEIAAAYCAGGLSCQSACKVAFFRGKLTATLANTNKGRGAMMSVGLSEAEMEPFLEKLALTFGKSDVTMGCINSASNVTLTGNEAQIDALKLLLEENQIFARKLQVDVAYHSPQMYDIADEYLMAIQDLQKGDVLPERPTMVSSVTSERVSADELCRSEYWVKNLVSPVRFSDALTQISSNSAKKMKKKLGSANREAILVHDLLEIGPHSALRGPTKDILKTTGRNTEVTYNSVMVRNVSALDTTLDIAGRLHCSGYPVNITEINRPGMKPQHGALALSDLPEYPFDHSQIHWRESRLSKEGFRCRKHPPLDLLGTPVPDWNPLEARWRKFMKLSSTPWIEDHKINGSILFPAAGMLVMAIEGVHQMADEGRTITGYSIKDVTFHKSLNISLDPDGVETQLYLRPIRDMSDKNTEWSEFRICVYEDGQWDENCRGHIQVEYEQDQAEVDAGKEASERQRHYGRLFENGVKSCNRKVEWPLMYEHLRGCGLEYGPAFQALRQLSCNDAGEATAEVNFFRWSANENTNHPQPHIVHPTTLDAVAQLMYVALTKGAKENIPTTIPTRIHKLWVSHSGLSHPTGDTVKAYSKSIFKGYRGAESSMFALDMTGKLLLSIDCVETTSVASRDSGSQVQADQKNLCCNIDWKPDHDLLEPPRAGQYCEAARSQEVAPVQFYQDLGFILIMFISKTLDKLAVEPGNPKPYLQHYIRWMRHQVDKFNTGKLSVSRPEWEALMVDTEYQEKLCDRIEATGIEGKFFVEIGRNLLKILQGEVDPLGFLFQGNLIEQYYRHVNTNIIAFRPLASYLDMTSHKNSGLKILEIGAGIGATTSHILNALAPDRAGEDPGTPRYTQYDYTDISPAFFESARELFKSHNDRMRFKSLDIEGDPVKQGFDLGQYDLIVAGSVLHATKDLDVTLRNVRALLKPGGKLALFEVTEDVTRAGFAFGLLPGWWLSAEDYRSWGPCISKPQWHDVLCRNDFSGNDLVIPDFQDSTCHEFSIIISTAVEKSSTPPHFPKTRIIISEDSSTQRIIAQKLENYLLSKGAMDCDVLSIQNAIVATDIGETFFIVLTELEHPLLATLDEETFKNMQRILTSASGLLWVTGGGGSSQDVPEYRMVDGLARVLRTEFNKLVLVTLALESVGASIEGDVTKITQVLESTFSSSKDDYESEFVEKNGMLHIGRAVEARDLSRDVHAKTSPRQSKMQEFGQGPPLTLTIANPGLLDSLQFLEDKEHREPLAPEEVEIEVKATGVNFMDCLTALGRVNQKTLGGECAGIVRRSGADCDLRPGDRVCACTLDTFKTYARSPAPCVAKIPDELTFVEAATLPVIFITAHHALHELARIQSGESVLIHAGAGGTGQAAIQISKHIGAEIYVTVGSEEKKKLLMDLYDLPEDHIFYSRDTSFAQGVMRMTHNQGVDVILNSLAGEGLVSSWECIAPFGRFIEIGKRDIHSHGNLPMFPFAKNVSFSAIDLASMVLERPALVQRSLASAMTLVADKKLRIVQPLHIYGISEVENAFRYMQGGKNTGKTVVEMKSDDLVLTVLDTKPAYHFNENATYVIAGGLGGLGRSVARWMASRGARHLILLSRSGPRTEAAFVLLEELRGNGVNVETPACDVTRAESLSAALAHSRVTMPPIKGCIQGTMILRDAVFENMTFEDWKISIGPKVQGSWNLHALLPQGMDFFIFLSSVSGVIGSGGQANYAAGNTYMDALAHHRIMKGEKATTLDLGWMESEGVVAENEFLQTGLAAAGYLMPISQEEFHALLDHHCNPKLDLPTPLECQTVVGLETPAALRVKGMKEPHWMQRATFRHFHQMGLSETTSSSGASENAVDYVAMFRAASSLPEAGRVVSEGLVKKLSKALAMAPEDIDTTKPLHAYGVDSLLAVELRNWFAKELSADVAVFDIMGGSSFAGVGTTVAAKSQFRQASWTDSTG